MDLTFDFMKEYSSRSFLYLKCNAIFLFVNGICERISEESIPFYEDLSSKQQEANTKVILHGLHALQTSNGNACIRSPSGDTAILVIAW